MASVQPSDREASTVSNERSPNDKISPPGVRVVFSIPDSRLPTPHLQVRWQNPRLNKDAFPYPRWEKHRG